MGSAHDGDAEFARKYFALGSEWLEEGKLRPQRITIVEGGLVGVDGGLQKLYEKKVAAEKLVYRIADTPGLS